MSDGAAVRRGFRHAGPFGSSILKVRDVTVRFGGVAALGGVDLDFIPAEICGLIGPNGAGKTTLFDVLAGLHQPTSGVVEYQGETITHRSPTWRARHGIRRTFQRQQTFGWLSVEDNMMAAMEWRGGGGGLLADLFNLPTRRRSEAERRQLAGRVLELCGLTDIKSLPAGKLSIGRARMVEMARAIVDRPTILLLDEPTSGLEESEAEQFGETMKRIRCETGCTILLVEHDMHFVMGQCDRIVVLNLGMVIAEGSPEAIRADPGVGAAYLG